MASDAQITTAVTAAVALGLTDVQMLALARRAVADLLSSGRPIIGYKIAGQELTFSMFQAQALEKYYQERVENRGRNQAVISVAQF